MTDWTNTENIKSRAADMRRAAETDRQIADMRIQFAVLLEDIANALDKTGTMTWLSWGEKVKCSECGAVASKKTPYCAECGRKAE